MQFKQLFKDERAVSPVIGVILMVAITVILAAVIGTFVIGLGNNLQETPPNANFQFDYAENSSTGNGYDVTATHQGGETIDSDNADSLTINASSYHASAVDSDGEAFDVSSGVSSGTSKSIWEVSSGADVRVIWTSTNGGNSQTLADGQVPN